MAHAAGALAGFYVNRTWILSMFLIDSFKDRSATVSETHSSLNTTSQSSSCLVRTSRIKCWTLSLRAGPCTPYSHNGVGMLCQKKDIESDSGTQLAEVGQCHFPLLCDQNGHRSKAQIEPTCCGKLPSLSSSCMLETFGIFLIEDSLDCFGL